MKLSVLIDNNTIIDRYFLGEPGLSFLIEDQGVKVIFDLGYSAAFLENAAKMGESLLDLDYVVFSHGHMDHTWGLDPLIRLYAEAKGEKWAHTIPTIIGHPLVFETKICEELGEIGSLISREKASRHFPLCLSSEPVWLTENLVFLGQIPRTNDFENKTPIGHLPGTAATSACGCGTGCGCGGAPEAEDDFMMDDSAMAYKGTEGLTIITGCSHAGICNIIEQAKKVCGEDKIAGIIGGLHLLNPEEAQMKGTLHYLKSLHLNKIHPCHCTDLASKIALSAVAKVEEVGSGLVIIS